MQENWTTDGNTAGYIDEKGKYIVCEEYGTAEQLGTYDIEVQNNRGYYNAEGNFVAYKDK